MNAPQILKIACPSCAGHVEFPAEMRGQIIDCPHCGLSVLLELPGTTARPVAPPPPAAPQLSAQHFNVHKQEVRKEIESARIGRYLVLAGSLMMIGSIGGCATGTDTGTGIGVILFLGGIAVFVAGRLHQN
jgi:DNA-directed RNA polymerase subunit RPC12/RpoP